MEYKKSVWRVRDVICHNCGKKWTIQSRKPDIYVCPECVKKNKKAEEREFYTGCFASPIIWLISILLFPLGYLMFFSWRKSHPGLAKWAFIGATMQVAFLLLLEVIKWQVGI